MIQMANENEFSKTANMTMHLLCIYTHITDMLVHIDLLIPSLKPMFFE